MRRSFCITLIAAALAAGCGRNAELPVTAAEETDLRPLMPQIAALEVEPTPGGAIVRATGLPPQQGYWEGALTPLPRTDPSVLEFEFLALPPQAPTRVSTPRSRYVDVAIFLDRAELAGIREIRVTGATNARAARR